MKKIESANYHIDSDEEKLPSESALTGVVSNEIEVPEPLPGEGMPAEAHALAIERLKLAMAAYKEALGARNRAMSDASQRALKAAERDMRVAQIAEANLRRANGDPVAAMKALEAKQAELEPSELMDDESKATLAKEAATFEEALESLGEVRHAIERKYKRSF